MARLLRSAPVLARGGVLAILTPLPEPHHGPGGFFEADLEHVRPYSALRPRERARAPRPRHPAAGPEPETIEPLWTWHPARLLRNLTRAALARILLGKDWRGANVYLVARKGEAG